jgi:P-type Cu+ transporter
MKVKDPVCRMMIDSDRAAAQGTYGGQPVYFCSSGCQETYEARLRARMK